MTKRAEFTCLVKETAEGAPWLSLECLEGNANAPGPMKVKILSMTLRPGTTYEQATELALQIRQHVVGLSVT